MTITSEQYQALLSTQMSTVDTSNFKPEEKLSYAVNQALTAWSFQNRISGVWFHVPNEVRVPKMEPHQAKRFWDKRAAIGIKPGAPDWVIAWQGGFGFIELKVKGGKMSDNQTAFQTFCRWLKINHAVCKSVEDVETTLKEWGALA